MSGYQQAVENLAWKITEFSIRDFDPVAELMDGDHEKMLAWLELHPEQQAEWDKLEEISEIVCQTYDTDYNQLVTDVWMHMMKMEMDNPEYWN